MTRVLAFTASKARPMLLRNCILQMRSQSHPVDHGIYVDGDPAQLALYEDLGGRGQIFLAFGPGTNQHEHYLKAIHSARPLGEYDLFCKIDDDDLYSLHYIKAVVRDFEQHGWDYSGAHSDGLLKGREWLPQMKLKSLGQLPEDRELGCLEVMPPTVAFSRRGIDCILGLTDIGGFEDIGWQRAIAKSGLRQSVRGSSGFVYNVHGQNGSTGHWLEPKSRTDEL